MTAADSAQRPIIEIRDVHKSFGRVEVLKGVSMSARRGTTACIIGPSGSGKSTLLRCINALVPIDSGSIRVGEVEERARALLAKVRLSDKADAYPGELSGGQQQRVAIARSLAMSPEIMLFDEVTAALDPETVKGVLLTIRELAEEGMTCLLVTHEMGFAREVANRVYFTDGGRIVEEGTPAELFEHPRDPRTREFLGQVL